ncbi:MAG: HesA/MoeB/ThiF family protein [Spirochaetes bacterium]|nr:HesA/MoeB/ThiF family protein [Spirochaetota bacterium]
MALSEKLLERYKRQLVIDEIGGPGQVRLSKARITIIGAGGLGSSAAFYLTAAGIGTITMIDPDKVGLSDLNRQILYSIKDINRSKVLSAKKRLKTLNPDIKIEAVNTRIDMDNINGLIKDQDFIIDATDNFKTKYLINDACVRNQKAFSHAGVLRFEGQSMTYIPGHSCLRCLFPEPPPLNLSPSPKEAGILGSVAGMIGSVQATEAIKFILETGELLIDTLLTVNLLKMDISKIKIRKNKKCPACISGK